MMKMKKMLVFLTVFTLTMMEWTVQPENVISVSAAERNGTNVKKEEAEKKEATNKNTYQNPTNQFSVSQSALKTVPGNRGQSNENNGSGIGNVNSWITGNGSWTGNTNVWGSWGNWYNNGSWGSWSDWYDNGSWGNWGNWYDNGSWGSWSDWYDNGSWGSWDDWYNNGSWGNWNDQEGTTNSGTTDSTGNHTVKYHGTTDTITEEEYQVLLRIVEAEATTEDVKGKMLVANVILNRVHSDSFPDTISEVVFQDGQFSPISDGRYYTVTITAETIEAVNRVLAGEDESQGALYFMNPDTASASGRKWFEENLVYLFSYEGHAFYTEK